MMHTFLLKLNGVLVYFVVIFSFFFNTTYMVSAILIICFLAFIEEIYIFVKFGDVDPDTSSVLSLMKQSEVPD